EKVWNYKYKDTVKISSVPSNLPGISGDVQDITAENSPEWNVVIEYDKNGVDCYIYSDKEISGLELVGTDLKVGE
ncbi:MAG: hypothetical protein JRI42_06980, partial [Deltaproteobacteria bacterium]|nr:hypothetical protein [Deltaproteobacteria bacterium]